MNFNNKIKVYFESYIVPLYSILTLLWRKILKPTIEALAIIPVFMSVLHLMLFGFKGNTWIINPVLRPAVECINDPIPTSEVPNYRYKTKVNINIPFYLKILPFSWSMPFKLKIETDDGVSFSKKEIESIFLKNKNQIPIYIQTEGSKSGLAEKYIFINFRFTSKDPLILKGVITTPNFLGENECPFTYESVY